MERDLETELDYAQARMYSSKLGRFSTVDPLFTTAYWVNPQSLNRYVYCFNNPLNLIDSNGKWPTATHQLFINEAFQGLNVIERGLMMLGSNSVDTLFGTGSALDVPITLIISEAPKHSMTPEGISPEEAMDAADDWIEGNMQTALSAARGGMVLAMYSFGKGAHTLMDNTSPSHKGFQPYNFPRTGNVIDDTLLWIKELLEHKRGEEIEPTDEQKRETVMLLRSYYLGVFGLNEFRRAVPNKQDQINVIRFMRRNGLNFSVDGLPTAFRVKRRKPRLIDSPIPGSSNGRNNTA